MKKKDLKRILKNLDELGNKFELIDRQIDNSMKVSGKTLMKYIDI